MPKYCSINDVMDKMPIGIPMVIVTQNPGKSAEEQLTIWHNIIEDWINSISMSIDDAIGDIYPKIYNNNAQRFPDRGSGTPASVIESCSLYLKARLIAITPINSGDNIDTEKELIKRADKIISEIKQGYRILDTGVGPVKTKLNVRRGNVFTNENFDSWNVK